jgi:plastocyanin
MATMRARLVLAAAALALALPGGAPAENPRLQGVVGPGFTISFSDASHARVTQVEPGTYEIAVDDRSDEHSFHLVGPGVDENSGVGFVGTATWTVALAEGDYMFFCDPHPTRMRGRFAVGNAAPPPPSPPPASAVTRLLASVGPGRTIGVRTPAGATVSSVRAGAVSIVVRDRSAAHDFHLTGPGVNRRTTVAFTGTQTWKLLLRKGVYRFVCDPHRQRMRGSFRVT